MSQRPIFVELVRYEKSLIGQVRWRNLSSNSVRFEFNCANTFNQLKKQITKRYSKYNQPIFYYIGDEGIAYMRFKRGGLWV